MKTEDKLIQQFIEMIDEEIEDYDLEPLIADAFQAFRKTVADLYEYEEEADDDDEEYEYEDELE